MMLDQSNDWRGCDDAAVDRMSLGLDDMVISVTTRSLASIAGGKTTNGAGTIWVRSAQRLFKTGMCWFEHSLMKRGSGVEAG